MSVLRHPCERLCEENNEEKKTHTQQFNVDMFLHIYTVSQLFIHDHYNIVYMVSMFFRFLAS